MRDAGGRRSRRAARLAALAIALAATAAARRSLRRADSGETGPLRHRSRRACSGRAVAEGLNDRLAQFERETSNQILVWIDRRIPEGFTLEDFTVRAAQKWGAGQKKTDNGAVLFVFTEDRKSPHRGRLRPRGSHPRRHRPANHRERDRAALPRRRLRGRHRGGGGRAHGRGAGGVQGHGTHERRRGAPAASIGSCLPWLLIFGVFFLLPWFLRRNRNYRTFRGDGWSNGVGGFPIIFPGRRAEEAGRRAAGGGPREAALSAEAAASPAAAVPSAAAAPRGAGSRGGPLLPFRPGADRRGDFEGGAADLGGDPGPPDFAPARRPGGRARCAASSCSGWTGRASATAS